jgi:hypothetical protein
MFLNLEANEERLAEFDGLLGREVPFDLAGRGSLAIVAP